MILASVKANGSAKPTKFCKTLVHGEDFQALSELVGEDVVLSTSDIVWEEDVLQIMKEVLDSDPLYGLVYTDHFRIIDGHTLFINRLSYSKVRNAVNPIVPLFGTLYTARAFGEVVDWLKTIENCSLETKLDPSLKFFDTVLSYHIPLPGFSV